MNWKEYQEEVAVFFRALGLEAETDVTVQGVRTTHDVDVLVKSKHTGFEVTWIVECKLWNTKVTKLHVLALREIVSDIGADRGILLAENGFQSGAVEACALTNIHLTSLHNVTITASHDVMSMRLREAYDRILDSKAIYWDIPKWLRIKHELRPDVGETGYSGNNVIEILEDLAAKGFRGVYPIFPTDLHVLVSGNLAAQQLPSEIDCLESLLILIESMLAVLEGKLARCVSKLSQ
ncbi:restriction endonuclease [Pseudomonas corrugata]